MYTTAVVLVALVVGCTGFLTSIMALSLAWLIPSVRRGHPEIIESPRARVRSIQDRAPHRGPKGAKKAELVPRPEPIRRISFDERIPKRPTSAPVIARSFPRGRPALLSRCKNQSPQTGVIPLPPASAPIVADSSPLSSAETLAEVPQEVKRAFSSRLTRALLLSRGRPTPRTSTFGSNTASSSSVAETSEFGERMTPAGKVETRSGLDAKPANITEKGRFGFLRKSKTVGSDRPRSRSRPAALSLPSPLPFAVNVDSSADSISPPPPRITDSPDPISPPSSTASTRSIHRRVSSTPSTSSKLRISDKLCPRKEKEKVAEPKPKPARTQPYGPPYNWIPPTPGAWAVVEGAEESTKTEQRPKRASVSTDQAGLQYVAYHERERAGSMPITLPAM